MARPMLVGSTNPSQNYGLGCCIICVMVKPLEGVELRVQVLERCPLPHDLAGKDSGHPHYDERYGGY